MDCGPLDINFLEKILDRHDLDAYDVLGFSEQKAFEFNHILDNIVFLKISELENKFEIELDGTWDFHLNYLDSSVWVNSEALRNCIRSKYPELEEEEIEFHYEELSEAIESIL